MYSIYLLISDLVLRPDGRTDVKRHKFSRVEHFKLGHYPATTVLDLATTLFYPAA